VAYSLDDLFEVFKSGIERGRENNQADLGEEEMVATSEIRCAL
jgi:hypothetical protein